MDNNLVYHIPYMWFILRLAPEFCLKKSENSWDSSLNSSLRFSWFHMKSFISRLQAKMGLVAWKSYRKLRYIAYAADLFIHKAHYEHLNWPFCKTTSQMKVIIVPLAISFDTQNRPCFVHYKYLPLLNFQNFQISSSTIWVIYWFGLLPSGVKEREIFTRCGLIAHR